MDRDLAQIVAAVVGSDKSSTLPDHAKEPIIKFAIKLRLLCKSLQYASDANFKIDLLNIWEETCLSMALIHSRNAKSRFKTNYNF
jgi:hypothetical protein